VIGSASANVVDPSVTDDATWAAVNVPVHRRAAPMVAIVMPRAAMVPVILGEFSLGLVEAGLGLGVDPFRS
jgi:hypothetical protein